MALAQAPTRRADAVSPSDPREAVRDMRYSSNQEQDRRGEGRRRSAGRRSWRRRRRCTWLLRDVLRRRRRRRRERCAHLLVVWVLGCHSTEIDGSRPCARTSSPGGVCPQSGVGDVASSLSSSEPSTDVAMGAMSRGLRTRMSLRTRILIPGRRASRRAALTLRCIKISD